MLLRPARQWPMAVKDGLQHPAIAMMDTLLAGMARRGLGPRRPPPSSGIQARLGLPEMKAGAQFALQTDAHVLKHAQVRKHGRDLERAHHAGTRLGDVLALLENLTRGDGQKLGEQVKHRRLARAIGPNQRVNRATPDLDVDPIDRDKTLEPKFGS